MTIGSHTVPPLSLPHQEGTHRILHIHNNVPGVLSEINSTLSSHNINILGQYLKTNEQIGYVVLDIDKRLSNQALQLLKECPANHQDETFVLTSNYPVESDALLSLYF